MLFISSRAKARSLTVMALAAVPLLAPVAANAAMAGALPATTTLLPDLRSATVTNVNTTDVETTVRFCFNKNIGSLPDPDGLEVGIYDDTNNTSIEADRATRSTPQCADAVYENDLDAAQYTFATADEDAVVNAANGEGNEHDSTALVGSNTNNGTAGKTTGPDLTGITVNNSTDTINYIFDQNVDDAAVTSDQYFFNEADGDTVGNVADPANDITIAGNVVRVEFADVTDAVRGYVIAGAVTARAQPGETNPLLSVARPGRGGFTARPDLQSTTLVASAPGSVDFTFDETVSGAPTAADFTAFRSDGAALPGQTAGAVPGSNNTIRVNFSGMGTDAAAQNEYLVVASVDEAAGITSTTNPGLTNTAGGLPVGGNTGAFAQGFTTGPEALTVSFDNASGVATVLLDQRFVTSDLGSFNLFDDTGNEIADTAISVSGAGGQAGRQTVRIEFDRSQLSGARSLQLEEGALTTSTGAANVPQIVAPTATAAVLKKGSKAKFRAAKGLAKSKRK